jgi:hypothetical protein
MGPRFFYVDGRTSDGMPAMMEKSGEAHAKFYTWFAEQKEQEQGHWRATFIDGMYTRFPVVDRLPGQGDSTFVR